MKIKNESSKWTKEDFINLRRVYSVSTTEFINETNNQKTTYIQNKLYNYSLLLDKILIEDKNYLLFRDNIYNKTGYLENENNEVIKFNYIGEIKPYKEGWLFYVNNTDDYEINEFYYTCSVLNDKVLPIT
jgi:hypothetical protein